MGGEGKKEKKKEKKDTLPSFFLFPSSSLFISTCGLHCALVNGIHGEGKRGKERGERKGEREEKEGVRRLLFLVALPPSRPVAE